MKAEVHRGQWLASCNEGMEDGDHREALRENPESWFLLICPRPWCPWWARRTRAVRRPWTWSGRSWRASWATNTDPFDARNRCRTSRNPSDPTAGVHRWCRGRRRTRRGIARWLRSSKAEMLEAWTKNIACENNWQSNTKFAVHFWQNDN